MKRSNEAIVQNTPLENVLQYLYHKLKEIHNVSFDETLKDGTIYYYSAYLYPIHSNKIEVAYSNTITPKGDVEKTYSKWDMYPAMSFIGLQLQTNTVLIKGECKHPFFVPIFDVYWADMRKVFGSVQADLQQTTQIPPKPPEPKGRGGNIGLWLSWYHSMHSKGYKCTLEEVAQKSGYSLGYIKQKNMVYQASRENP